MEDRRDKNPYYIYPVRMRTNDINSSRVFQFQKTDEKAKKLDAKKIRERSAKAALGMIVSGGGARMLNPDFMLKGRALTQEEERKTFVNKGHYFNASDDIPIVSLEQINWPEFINSDQYNFNNFPNQSTENLQLATTLHKIESNKIAVTPNPTWILGYVVSAENPQAIAENFGIKTGAFFINKTDAEYFATHKDIKGDILAQEYFANLNSRVLSNIQYSYSKKRDMSFLIEPLHGELALPELMVELGNFFAKHDNEAQHRSMVIEQDAENGIAILVVEGSIPREFFSEHNIDPDAIFLKKGDELSILDTQVFDDVENISREIMRSVDLANEATDLQPNSNAEFETRHANQGGRIMRAAEKKPATVNRNNFFHQQNNQNNLIADEVSKKPGLRKK